MATANAAWGCSASCPCAAAAFRPPLTHNEKVLQDMVCVAVHTHASMFMVELMGVISMAKLIGSATMDAEGAQRRARILSTVYAEAGSLLYRAVADNRIDPNLVATLTGFGVCLHVGLYSRTPLTTALLRSVASARARAVVQVLLGAGADPCRFRPVAWARSGRVQSSYLQSLMPTPYQGRILRWHRRHFWCRFLAGLLA